MDDDDRIGALYQSLKHILNDQFVFEKVLSESTEAELQLLEDLCSRCAAYKQQVTFSVISNITPVLTWKNVVWQFLGRSRK